MKNKNQKNKLILQHYILIALLLPLTGCSDALKNVTFLPATLFSLQSVGYQSQEYFISGKANSYLPVGELGSDGQWNVEENDQAEYTTRIVVFRPIDPAKFNGTVIVEWNNVSGNTDAPAEWNFAHTEFIREGYAWVGISAQRKGIDNVGNIGLLDGIVNGSLKKINPLRYNRLSHPGDSFSYSMFHQISQSVRHPADQDYLQGLRIERMIAAGESQSAARMISYINMLGKTPDLFDGFLVHSRFGSSAPISENPQPAAVPPSLVKIREDLGKPVLMLQTETDLFVKSFLPGNAYENRQADTDIFRLWEVAGTSHADSYSILGLFDQGTSSYYAKPVSYPYAVPFVIKCDSPVNGNPIHHFTANAAFHALDQWIRDGIAPTIASRLEVEGNPPHLATDEFGNARGGIRSPYVDVPTATYGGIGSSNIMCMIFGTMENFRKSKLKALYSSREEYLSRVRISLEKSVADAFLRPADAEKIWQASEELAEKIPL